MSDDEDNSDSPTPGSTLHSSRLQRPSDRSATDSSGHHTEPQGYDTPQPARRTPTPVDPLEDSEAEDLVYERALEASRLEYAKQSAKNASKKLENKLVLNLSNEFAPLLDLDGDTLVYIGAPPKTKEQSDLDYKYVQHHFEQLHRVSSKTLRAMGSTKLEKMLGPQSIRTERRLRKFGILRRIHLEGIKFYVDLQPPSEDDEAVMLLTELTCTRGILQWYRAQKKYSIAPTMVCGRDDFKRLSDQLRPLNSSQTVATVGEVDESGESRNASVQAKPNANTTAEVPSQDLDLEPEYSPLRHRSAIERVLQAITHGDPKLDSAPKVWTYFQVARYLDCATNERVNGWISKWLLSPPNTNFIQNNPEVVYRIGLGIMSPDLIRDAFAMLVGEKALINVVVGAQPALLSHVNQSVHGRALELLDDDERNRIDHAAESLVRRVRSKFELLVDVKMKWLEKSSKYRKLLSFHPHNEHESHEHARILNLVKEYVRGRILWVLSRNYRTDHPGFDRNLRSVGAFRSGMPNNFHETYANLNEQQRLLTHTFWIALQTEKIQEGEINTHTPSRGTTGIEHSYKDSPIARKMLNREAHRTGTGVVRVNYKDLSQSIADLYKMNAKHDAEAQIPRQDGEQEARLHRVAGPTDSNADVFDDVDSSIVILGEDVNDEQKFVENTSEDDSSDYLMMSSPKRSYAEFSSTGERRGSLIDEDANGFSATRPLFVTEHPVPRRTPEPLAEQETRTSIGRDVHSVRADQATEPAQHPQRRGLLFDIHDQHPAANDDDDQAVPDNRHAYPATSHQLHQTSNIPGQPQDAISATFRNASNYDAYSRNVAEDVNATCWRAMNGDLYLRAREGTETAVMATHPKTQISTHGTVWYLAPDAFKHGKVTRRIEDGIQSEYWRASNGSLYQLRQNVIQYVTENAPIGSMIHTEPEARAGAHAQTKSDADMQLRQGFQAPSYPSQSKPTPGFQVGPQKSDQSALSDSQRFLKAQARQKQASSQRIIDQHGHQQQQQQQKQKTQERHDGGSDFVYLGHMLYEFSTELGKYCKEIVCPAHLYRSVDSIPRDLMDTLMCLNDEEWKYLPLWAGGNDDGTGGVFDEADVPILEAGGFRGGKRGLGLGRGTVDGGNGEGSVSGTSSSFDDVASDAVSSVGRASKHATDGTDTVRSLSDASSSDGGFLRQDELWDEIRDMKDVGRGGGLGNPAHARVHRGIDAGDGDEDGDVSTVMGAGSDVQGDMFHDLDDDDNDNNANDAMNDDDDDDSDLEIIEKDDL